jgi:hypothetical protein
VRLACFEFYFLEIFMTFKTYVGFVRDHTGSMVNIASAAARDYNSTIATIRNSAIEGDQDTVVTVVKCGHQRQAIAHTEIVNSSVIALKDIPENAYEANAPGTPLFDSVGLLIETLKANAPDRDDQNVSFLCAITTDGGENASRRYSGNDIARMIKELQLTDRWTFAFRVPPSSVRSLINMGIPAENILPWDNTNKGQAAAQQANTQAMSAYFKGRATGQKSSTKFYASLSDVSIEDVKTQLTDISASVKFFGVGPKDVGRQIRDFVEEQLNGSAMVKGGAFYQLVKTEPKVQDNKRIAIRDKKSGAVYAGDAARHMLALPTIGTVRLAPDELGDYEVFIQSTSVNRKLDANTKIMYWEQVGVAFKEGVSAR